MAKRARGILSREVKKTGRQSGRATQRFLGAVSCQGHSCRFETVDALCRKVYELSDTYGLGAGMLTTLAAGAMAAGYDVILCPSPLFPDRAEHLLIPELSLAFVTSTPTLTYPGRPYRRIRLDAMTETEGRSRLRFQTRMTALLREEAIDALKDAKRNHDALEAVYNPYVDFDGVRAQAALEAGRLLSYLK